MNSVREAVELPKRNPEDAVRKEPSYMTPREVAEMLKVDDRTVLRWAQQDASMPVTRIGRVIRFERELLLRWLARKRPRTAQRSAQEHARAA